MSAPQIPNLLDSLRSTRGRSRGSGRGGRNARMGQRELSAAAQDKIVQQTDNDALGSRLSAVDAYYLHDPFIKAFAVGPIQKRDPIINKGTFVRTTAVDSLVEKFLATDPDQPKQIVSLGAGSDTRIFRILSARPSIPLVYHEIDFPTNTRQKIATIKRTPALLSVITSQLADHSDLDISDDLTSLRSPLYNVHPLDLRALVSRPSSFDPDSEPTPLPNLPNLSSTTPTLILSECCLIYLSPNDADGIVETLTTKLIPAPTPLSVVIYEPFRPDDNFGKVMIANLARRGIVLQTLKKYSTLHLQRERLRKFGFSSGQASADMKFIWYTWLSDHDRDNLHQTIDEKLDGIEEWEILVEHYCVTWGWRDGDGSLFTTAWSDFPNQPLPPGEEEMSMVEV